VSKLKDRLYNDFCLENCGFDFLGYTFDSKKELTFHHIQPKNYDGKTTYDNGALLIKTSHNYIHTIENYDFKMFVELSQILKDEHKCRAITKEHLLEIKKILEYFEEKNKYQYTSKGLPIIKEEFVRRRKF